MGGPGGYMVLVEEGAATTAPAMDVSRAEAWRVTRELREAGKRAYIILIDGETTSCVVAPDDPLPND